MKKNIAIVLGSFHKDYMEQMLGYALQEAETYSLKVVKEIWVPGSMEKPITIKKLLMNQNIDGIAVLGIIEKGETQHGLVMGTSVINSIVNLQLEFLKPIGVGIIGPGASPDQIPVRIEPYARKAISALVDMFKMEI